MTTPDPSLSDRLAAAEASVARARAAGHRFDDLRAALRVLSNELRAAGYPHSERTAAHAQTADDAASAAFESAAALEVCAQQLRTLEAEVARLRAEAVEARAVEAAAVVAWLRAELPPPHLFDPYEKGDVALEFAANEIERGSHRAGAGGAR